MVMVPFGNQPVELLNSRLPKVTIKRDHRIEWHHYLGLQVKSGLQDNFIGCGFFPDKGMDVKVELKNEKEVQKIYCSLGSRKILYEISADKVSRR